MASCRRSPFTFGKVFVGYAYAEGWAHYSEEMMLEAGLGGIRGVTIGPIENAPTDDVYPAGTVAMARQGGIGVLHRNLSIEDQAYQVDLVKRTQTGIISNPVTIGPDATLEDLDRICGEYRVSGLPVVDVDNHLLGIITNRDLRFTPVAEWATTKVDEVMTPMPLVTGAVAPTPTSLAETLSWWPPKVPEVLGLEGVPDAGPRTGDPVELAGPGLVGVPVALEQALRLEPAQLALTDPHPCSERIDAGVVSVERAGGFRPFLLGYQRYEQRDNYGPDNARDKAYYKNGLGTDQQHSYNEVIPISSG